MGLVCEDQPMWRQGIKSGGEEGLVAFKTSMMFHLTPWLEANHLLKNIF